MILRGSDNLHRCAWIGEEDSLEEEQNNPPTAEDIANLRIASNENSDEYEDEQRNRRIGSRIFISGGEPLKILSDNTNQNPEITSNEILTSEERKGHVKSYIKKALKFSKGRNELMDILNAHHGIIPTRSSENPAKNIKTIKPEEEPAKNVKSPLSEIKSRFERSMVEEDHDGAFEIMDEVPIATESVKKYTRQEIGVEQIVGDLEIPAGLTYERGFFNQSTGNDLSREEHKSSYSSSEEALASCEGVILALPLQPDSKCHNFQRQESNKIAYDISVDGTYYFVFSSDNEIVVNDLFFNLTLDKVVYDTSQNLANCTASNNCSLSIGFWSEDKTVVDVPPSEHFDESFILSTKCEPRVAIYLCLLLLVPIMILFCALQ